MYYPLFYNLENTFLNSEVEYICRKNTRINSYFLSPFNNLKLKIFWFKDIFYFKKYDYVLALHPYNPFLNLVFAKIYWKKQVVVSRNKKFKYFFKNFFHYNYEDYTFRVNNKFHNYYLKVVSSNLFLWKNIIYKPKISFKYKKDILKKMHLNTWEYVILSPFSQDITRSLDIDKITKISNELVRNWNKVILVWINKDFKFKETEKIYNLINRTSLEELLFLMENSKCNIVVETWTMHISAHMHKKTIALTRKVTPEQLCDDMDWVINLNNDEICDNFMKCKGKWVCLNKVNRNICVKTISVESILKNI